MAGDCSFLPSFSFGDKVPCMDAPVTANSKRAAAASASAKMVLLRIQIPPWAKQTLRCREGVLIAFVASFVTYFRLEGCYIPWWELLFGEARKFHTYFSAAETARYGGTVLQRGETTEIASRAEYRVGPMRFVDRRLDGRRCRGHLQG